MTNICRLNYITVLTIINLLLSYHATLFEILPLVLPTTSLIEPLNFNTIMGGVGKVRKTFAHVDIIEVNLMKFISKCYK